MSEREASGGAPVAAPGNVGSLSFDAALAELDAVVKSLESGGQPLEEALLLYERGVALHEHCVRLLSDAELHDRLSGLGRTLVAQYTYEAAADAFGEALRAIKVVPG